MARKCSARDRSLSFGCHRIFVDGPHAAAVRPGSHQETAMHRKMDSLLPLLLLVALTGYAQTVGATTYSLLRSYSYPATVSLGRSVAAVGDTIVRALPTKPTPKKVPFTRSIAPRERCCVVWD